MSSYQEKASKWDSLIKWIKDTKDEEDTDIWEKLEELGIDTSGEEDMKTISWVSKNSKNIDFTRNRSNEPDTEPESDTDYDTDDLPSDCDNCEECMAVLGGKLEVCDDCGLLLSNGKGWVKEEEEICPSCGNKPKWARCDCPNKEEEELVSRECFKCEKTYMGVELDCCCGECCSYCRPKD